MSLPIIRTSERRDFKRCQARWWWHYREGLKPRGHEKTPLWFGTGVHLGLAEWYIPGTKRGVHPAETFAEFAKDGIYSIKTADATEEAVAQFEEGLELGVKMLEGYVRHYGNDDHMDIIQAEHPFGLDIPWPDNTRQKAYIVEPGDIMALYRGTWDGVYRDLTTSKIKLLETKTAKAIVTTHLPLDDQAGSYWAIASMVLRKLGLLGPKERIHGIEYNFLRKALPDERPRDAEGYACNKPVKADFIAAINAERMKMPAPGPSGSWLGPPVTGKETLAMLGDIANKMGLTVLGERSKVQPGPLFVRETVNRTAAERRTQLRRIQDEAVQMQLLRDGTVTPTKNPTKDCSWDCDFYAMCELQERGGDWEDFKRIAYRVADPYADHRKSTEE